MNGRKKIWGQPLAKGTGVEIRLNTDMESFRKKEPAFIADLARALNIHPEQIRKINVLRGCVRFIADLPKESAGQLQRAKSTGQISSELKSVFAKHDINPRDMRFDVTEEAPYVKKVNQLSKELNKDGRILTWLHLSDVHFVDKPGALKWNQDLVKQDFIDSLPRLLAEWDLQPNLVFFTGDVAFSAGVEQYRIAKDFFDNLKVVLKNNIRTYIVPGNHDVSWKEIGKLDNQLRDKLTSRYKVSEYLLDPSQNTKRKKDFSKFSNYFDFAKEYVQSPKTNDEQEYFYIDHFEHLGIKLGIAGLNSAWRSTKKAGNSNGDPDINNLLLGEPQVITAAKNLETAQIRLALLHHPPGSMWFRDFDRKMHGAFFPKFDFVLRGHEHEIVADAKTDLNSGDEYVRIASGALYDPSEYEGKSGYPICFNVVRLNLDTGKGILFYWRYFTDYYKWARDVVADDGFKLFDIPEKMLERVRQRPPNHTPSASAARAGSRPQS